MRKERKHYTAEEKVAVLRRHLLDKVPVADLCEELSLKPTVFYRWQKEFFENGAAAFQAQERPHRQVEEKQKRIEFLEKADGQPQIHAERDRKLEAARKQRQVRRQQATWRTEKHVSDSPSNE
jgi:transposase